jgi:hypothetical protein
VAVLAASTLTLAPTALAGAAGQPNQTTGQPNQSCQTVVANGGTEPGHAAMSPGAPFNEVNGTGGTAYATGNGHSPQTLIAVSQYDVACANVTAHSH